MAAITVTVANARTVADITKQFTAEAAVAITAGQVIRLNASGKWVLAIGDANPNGDGCYIALRSAGVGQGLTGMKSGYMGGIDTAVAVGAAVYLSGTVAGGLNTAAGTVSVLIGRVVKPGIMEVAPPL